MGLSARAVGFSLIEILNRDPLLKFNVSPFFVALVAFCFSMTIGVLWEFFEFAMDGLFFWDMQKDTVLHSISSVALDPDPNSNLPIVIKDITPPASIDGQGAGLWAVDPPPGSGLYDTMESLFVNFVGAFLFSVLGYLNLKRHDGSKFVRKFCSNLDYQMRNKETQAHEALLRHRLSGSGHIENYRHVPYALIFPLYLVIFFVTEQIVTDNYWVSYLPLETHTFPLMNGLSSPMCCGIRSCLSPDFI